MRRTNGREDERKKPTLVHTGPDPAVVLARHTDLSNLKGGKIADAQPDKLASLMELIKGLEGLGERRGPVLMAH